MSYGTSATHSRHKVNYIIRTTLFEHTIQLKYCNKSISSIQSQHYFYFFIYLNIECSQFKRPAILFSVL